MTTNLPSAVLSLLRDLSDPGKWRRVLMWPGPSVIVVRNVKDVEKRAKELLNELSKMHDS